MEKHLKLSKSSIGTPMQVFKRLLRSMLGMDDPKTLATIMSPQVLSIFEEDYMLKSEDKKALEEALQKTWKFLEDIPNFFLRIKPHQTFT